MNRLFKMKFKDLYPNYVFKAEKKERTKNEVDEIICWLSGYTLSEFNEALKSDIDVETFFKEAPLLNPNRKLITGSVCGVKLAEVSDPIMKEVRYLDKLIDELAKGKSIDKILRK